MSNNPPKHWTTLLLVELDIVEIGICDIIDVDWDEEPTTEYIPLFV